MSDAPESNDDTMDKLRRIVECVEKLLSNKRARQRIQDLIREWASSAADADLIIEKRESQRRNQIDRVDWIPDELQEKFDPPRRQLLPLGARPLTPEEKLVVLAAVYDAANPDECLCPWAQPRELAGFQHDCFVRWYENVTWGRSFLQDLDGEESADLKGQVQAILRWIDSDNLDELRRVLGSQNPGGRPNANLEMDRVTAEYRESLGASRCDLHKLKEHLKLHLKRKVSLKDAGLSCDRVRKSK